MYFRVGKKKKYFWSEKKIVLSERKITVVRKKFVFLTSNKNVKYNLNPFFLRSNIVFNKNLFLLGKFIILLNIMLTCDKNDLYLFH